MRPQQTDPREKVIDLLQTRILDHAESVWTTPHLHITEGEGGVHVRFRQSDGRMHPDVVLFPNGDSLTFGLRLKMRFATDRSAKRAAA